MTRPTAQRIVAHNEAGEEPLWVDAMTNTVTQGPAILIGYEYVLQVEADAPCFQTARN